LKLGAEARTRNVAAPEDEQRRKKSVGFTSLDRRCQGSMRDADQRAGPALEERGALAGSAPVVQGAEDAFTPAG